MCLVNFSPNVYNSNGFGYKVFKKSKVVKGQYRGINFTSHGGYYLNRKYRETNTGNTPEGFPKGFHIFPSYNDAVYYKKDSDEVVIKVRYSGSKGFGYENGSKVVIASEMELLNEISSY
jgi:hypothetical protein